MPRYQVNAAITQGIHKTIDAATLQQAEALAWGVDFDVTEWGKGNLGEPEPHSVIKLSEEKK